MKYLTTFSALALTAGLVGSADASSLLVYEGFQYGNASATRAGADILDGQADGVGGDIDATGLGGTYTDLSSPGGSENMFLSPGSLSFSNLASTGNHVTSDSRLNNDRFARPITATMPTTGKLWFSFLANKLANNFGAEESGLVIGNQAVNNSKVVLDTANSGLVGFGIAPTAADSGDWVPYIWDGSSQLPGASDLSTDNAAVDGSEVWMLVGEISFDTGTAGADEFTLYTVNDDGDISIDDLVQRSTTIEGNVNQALLDTLSFTRQVQISYDEIRIGTTAESVLGLPEGNPVPSPTAALAGLIGLGGLCLRRRKG